MDISNKAAFLAALFLNLSVFALQFSGIQVAALPLLIFSVLGLVLVFLRNYSNSRRRSLKGAHDVARPNQAITVTEIENDPNAIAVLLSVKALENDYQEDSEVLGSPIPIPVSEISERANISLDLTKRWIGKLNKADFLKEGFGEIYGVADPGLEFLYKIGRLK